MGLFDDLLGVVGDLAKIAVAPVEVVASVARVVTKPIAEVAEEVVEAVRDEFE